GKREEAERFRCTARELFEKSEVEFVNDTERLNHLLNAGSCLRDAGDWEAAERFIRKALSLAGKLAEENATEPVHRQQLALRHGTLGIVLQRRGRLREAADQFRQEVVICERLVADFPEESSCRFRQVSALNFLGIALRELPGETA